MAKIECSVYRGPIGSHGFRTGQWPFTFSGKEYSVYLSIPHRLDIQEQEKLLLEACTAELVKQGVIKQ